MIGQELLSLLYGNPADQISQALNPNANPTPNPNPGAPPTPGGPSAPNAGGAGPGGAGGPQPPAAPPMAPANATQSPPDLASLYMQLHQQDRAANSIDRNTALMASAFGTAQQQHDMMNYAGSLQPDDRAGVVSQGLKAQAELTAQQEHNRFMAGSDMMGKLLNIDQPSAQWLMNNKDAMDDALKTHFAVEAQKATPTDAMKNADAGAQVWAAANPGATQQQIAAKRDEYLTGAIPGPAGEKLKTQAKDSQEFKDTALQDYTPVQSKLNDTASVIDQLLKNPDATVAAVKDPVPTQGPYAQFNPFMSQKTIDQSVLISKLKAGFTGDSLSNVKNLRNRMEFETLGKAATGGLDPASSREQILQTLQTMKNKILDARATSELAVGHKLTGELVGHGNRDLLDPNNAYYNGGTEDAAPASSSGGGSGGGSKTYTYNPKTGLLE